VPIRTPPSRSPGGAVLMSQKYFTFYCLPRKSWLKACGVSADQIESNVNRLCGLPLEKKTRMEIILTNICPMGGTMSSGSHTGRQTFISKNMATTVETRWEPLPRMTSKSSKHTGHFKEGEDSGCSCLGLVICECLMNREGLSCH